MRVLVACEESQVVCKAFRERGHEAYSCDLQECSGGHPEWHIHDDVFHAIYGRFKLQNGSYRIVGKWDMVIGFPPCTFIANAGQSNKVKDPTREQKTNQAIQFARKIFDCGVDKVAIENPIGVMSTKWRKPNQVIHPFYFGDPFRKYTCLWFLPILLSQIHQ